jgi:hypothetical protein
MATKKHARPTRKVTDEEVFALHRYFRWADVMRATYEETVVAARSTEGGRKPLAAGQDFDESRVRMMERAFGMPYMSYYHGGLYAVIEGWRRLALSDPTIDQLLKSPNVAKLESYRHGAFHFHPEYFDKKFLGLFHSDEGMDWVRSLRNAFHTWFRANHVVARARAAHSMRNR